MGKNEHSAVQFSKEGHFGGPLLRNADFLLGVAVVALGLLGIYLVSDLPLGTADRIGSAAMPLATLLLLAALGLHMVIAGLRGRGHAVDRMRLLPAVLVIGSIIVFGVLIEPLGLMFATFSSVLIATLATGRMSLFSRLATAAILTGFVVLVFVFLLGIPMDIFPNVLEAAR